MIAEELEADPSHTGVLLLQELPEEMELNFDHTSWKVQSKFKGIRNVPDGCHYLHYSLADEKNMFQIGRFLVFGGKSERTVIVLKWNKEYQDFVRVKGYEETVAVQAVAEGLYDCYLGGYPQQRIAIWQQSTNHISQAVLDKLEPLHTIYRIEQEYDRKAEPLEEKIEQLNIDDEE